MRKIHVQEDQFATPVCCVSSGDRSVTISIYRPATETEIEFGEGVPWSEHSLFATSPVEGRSMPDLSLAGSLIVSVPGYGGALVHTGKISFNLDATDIGDDEWVDYSIIDFCVDAVGTPVFAKSRFADSRETKIQRQSRHQQLSGAMIIASLCVPFADDVLNDDVVLLVQTSEPPIDSGNCPTVAPKTMLWRDYFYRAVVPELADVQPDQEVEIRFVMVDQDGQPVIGNTTLDAEATAGYLPRRRIAFVNGEATVRFIALGLESGDPVKIKLNSTHHTAIGTVEFNIQ